MDSVYRFSPIDLGQTPQSSEVVHGWRVTLSHGGQAHTRLIDLSHVAKWDLQDKNLSRFDPMGITIPDRPGGCEYANGILVSRMNQTQCAIWHLRCGAPEFPAEGGYTDISDGLALLAVCGSKSLDVIERISNLDLSNPGLSAPFLLQGPVLHIPCQVVRLTGGDTDQAVIMGFSRGYGHTMVDAILAAGADLGLSPGGMDDFRPYASY